MATIGTIAVRLTADPRNMQQGLAVAKESVETFAASTSKVRPAATNAGLALLELSRLVEDFKVGFDTNGLQGAIRGSLNNLAVFATLLGGPVTGAVVSFVAVGLAALIPFFTKSTQATKEARQELDNYRASLQRARDIERDRVRSQQELAKVTTSDEADRRTTSLQNELQLNQAEISKIVEQQRELERRRSGFLEIGDQFGATETQKQLNELFSQRIELFNRSLALEKDIEASRQKQLALTAQEKKEALEKLAIENREEIARDARSGQSVLRAQMAAISPELSRQFNASLQIRELANLNLPLEIQDALAQSIQQSLDRGRSTELPGFVREGTQEARQLDFQDAQRAKEQEVQQKQSETLQDIYDKLDDIYRQNKPVATDSINLDG